MIERYRTGMLCILHVVMQRGVALASWFCHHHLFSLLSSVTRRLTQCSSLLAALLSFPVDQTIRSHRAFLNLKKRGDRTLRNRNNDVAADLLS